MIEAEITLETKMRSDILHVLFEYPWSNSIDVMHRLDVLNDFQKFAAHLAELKTLVRKGEVVYIDIVPEDAPNDVMRLYAVGGEKTPPPQKVCVMKFFMEQAA